MTGGPGRAATGRAVDAILAYAWRARRNERTGAVSTDLEIATEAYSGPRSICITLALPHPLLTPNLRLHHMARARHTKAQREDAGWAARGALVDSVWPDLPIFPKGPHFPGRVRLDATIYPRPRMKRLDDDNLVAALKATRDGIADALDMDDRQFVIGSLTWAQERTGEIVLTLTEVQA